METTHYPRIIQLFFNEIVVKIKEALDPEIILVAGSFGKGSWLYFDDILLSDFEIVFICERRWSFKKKKSLLKSLNNEYPYEISLKGYLINKAKNKVISNYSSKNPGYISLDFFDVFNKPKYLYIKDGATLDINCDVEEIPVWEAWRLYVNRMGDLFKLHTSQNIDKKTISYYWLKIFESIADAYCIINRIYDKNISNRLTLFTDDLINNDNELNTICKESFGIIKQALIARNNHELSHFEINISDERLKLIINSWMNYFEKKLSEKEGMSLSNNFKIEYLKSKTLQKKYLGFNYKFNFLVSNSIRLIYHPKLLNCNFKFYNQNCSWRHLILLIISSAFYECGTGKGNYNVTKKISHKLFRNNYITKLNNKKFEELILDYWKKLC